MPVGTGDQRRLRTLRGPVLRAVARRTVRTERTERTERGAAAVEFGLVLIPLSMILFGIISYGYMLSFRQAVSQAAAEGARAAAVAPPTTPDPARITDARSAVQSALVTYGLTCGTGPLVCTVVRSATCTTCFEVTVDYDYEAEPLTPVFPGLGIVMPDHLVYTASAEVS